MTPPMFCSLDGQEHQVVVLTQGTGSLRHLTAVEWLEGPRHECRDVVETHRLRTAADHEETIESAHANLAILGAFVAGFMVSGEGWNGEYPFSDRGIDPYRDDTLLDKYRRWRREQAA